MPNQITTVTKYLPLLDEQYRLGAKSSILDVAPEFVRMTSDAKKVMIAKIRVDGLADYNKVNGFTSGTTDLTWEEHEFTQDRGRSISVDHVDNMETFGMAFGKVAGEFQTKKVIPEIDAYRFSTYYQKAAVKASIDGSISSILKFIDSADAQFDEDEIPEEDRILFVNPEVYNLMINDTTIQKKLDVTTVPGTINKKIYSYNEHPIIKVPSSRFVTKITLLDGVSQGEEAGHFTIPTDANVIGMMMIHKAAVMQLSKRRIARTWAPSKELAAGTDGVNPTADAWKFDFRVYHDAWALDEKTKGIYAAKLTGPGITISSLIVNTDGGPVAGKDGSVTVKQNSVTSTIDAVLNYGGTIISNKVYIVQEGVDVEYGTFALSGNTAVITPAGNNGTAAIVGTFTLKVKAGSVRTAWNLLNADITYELKVVA